MSDGEPKSAMKTSETDVSGVAGSVDRVVDGKLLGWAHRGGRAVRLDIFVDDEFVSTVQSNLPRADLIAQKIGARAFECALPDTLLDGAPHEVVVTLADGVDPVLSTPRQIVFDIPAGPAGKAAGHAADGHPIKDHPLSLYVDKSWYKKAYPEIAAAGQDPVAHYLARGWKEGREPNAYFDAEYYRAEAGLAKDEFALAHYASQGWKTGLSPSARFDTLAYLRAYPDVAAQRELEPLAHFLASGRKELRKALPVASATGVAQTGKQLSTPAEFFDNAQLEALTSDDALGLTRTAHFYRDGYDPSCLDIHWIIPDFTPGAGGHMSIFKTINWLEFLGHRNTVWINYPSQRPDAEDARNDIIRYFQPLKAQVRLLEPMSSIEADVLVLTDVSTVWSGLKHAQAGAMLYFVQDYEPMFFPAGSQHILAEETYKQGIPCFCCSPWLASKMKAFGNRVESFSFPIDGAMYYPASDAPGFERKRRALRASPLAGEDTVHIAFYGRHFTSRRAVELAVMGLYELHKTKPDILVHVFGQDWDPEKPWPFPVKLHGVMAEADLADLYRACDIGLALSATNYNIASIGMMGCRLPVVDISNESTRATFKEGTIFLAEPRPQEIAKTLARVIDDPKERKTRADLAFDWVTGHTYEDIAASFADFMRAELERNDALSARPGSVKPARDSKTPFATVCIPTYNPGEAIRDLLKTLQTQRAPWPFEILVIDSASTDGSVGIYKDFPDVRVIGIDQREFSHGGTRNRAMAAAKGEYVAFLTQDAIPDSEYWLYHLAGTLDAVDGAALAFGRHFAHTGADPFTVRDLDAHFDTLAALPPILDADTKRKKFRTRDESWLGLLRFNSDNNACYSRKVWERLRFRDIDYGEDQAYAWDAILAGYRKVYVDRAAVRHSHDYTAREVEERARTEMRYFKQLFGVDLSIKSQADYAARLSMMNGADIAFAIEAGLDEAALDRRLDQNAARLQGFNEAQIPLAPVFTYQSRR